MASASVSHHVLAWQRVPAVAYFAASSSATAQNGSRWTMGCARRFETSMCAPVRPTTPTVAPFGAIGGFRSRFPRLKPGAIRPGPCRDHSRKGSERSTPHRSIGLGFGLGIAGQWLGIVAKVPSGAMLENALRVRPEGSSANSPRFQPGVGGESESQVPKGRRRGHR